MNAPGPIERWISRWIDSPEGEEKVAEKSPVQSVNGQEGDVEVEGLEKHDLGGDLHADATLAELSAKVSDAELFDAANYTPEDDTHERYTDSEAGSALTV